MAARPPVPHSASAPAAPALVPLGHHAGKPPIPLFRPVTLIGSRSNARIHLTSSSVSKAHALVVRDGGTTYIRDLASRGHVYINGEQKREHDLQEGDLIKIGSFTFKFKAFAGADQSSNQSAAQSAQLDVSDVDYPVPMDGRVMLIGRRSASDIHLLEDAVSTAHAVILEMNGQRFVRDLGSRTGTYVNGVAVHQHQLVVGDNIRIGETTLTYSPARSPAEEEIQLGDDSMVPMAAEETGALDINEITELEVGHVVPRVETPAENEPALGEDALDALGLADEPQDKLPKSAPRSEAVIPPPSVDNPVDAMRLSDSSEKLSPAESTSEGEVRSDDVSSDAAGLPRRGWRAAPHSSEQTTPEQDDEAVLKFSQPTSSDESDQHSGAAVLDFPNDQEPSSDAIVNVDLSPDAASAPASSSPTASFDAIDLSSLSAESRDEAEVVDEIEETPAAPAPAMRFDQVPPAPKAVQQPAPPIEPLINLPPEVPVEVPAETSAEKVTASRTRRKPKDPVVEQAEEKPKKARGRKSRKSLAAPTDVQPNDVPPTDAPAEDLSAEVSIEPIAEKSPAEFIVPEVIDRTEPTPESALNLESATDGETVPETTIDLEMPIAESLSDTGLNREMHALSGETGEIVESEIAESESTNISEIPAPQTEQQSAEVDESYEWGANQENFLGGVPVELPPLDLPLADEPQAQTRAVRPATPNGIVSETESREQSGEALADVNALIDEILAPTSNGAALSHDLLNDRLQTNGAADEVEESNEQDDLDGEGDVLQPARDDRPAIEPAKTRHVAPLHLPPLAPMQSRPVIPIPPPLRGPSSRRRSSQVLEPVGDIHAAGAGLRDDERIPPYSGALPATVGRVTTSFDGLAMPPVREADVFFQMSPPASARHEDPFGGMTATAATSSPSALTPMDLVQADDSPRLRRPALSGRANARDLFFGGAPTQINSSGVVSSLTGLPPETIEPPTRETTARDFPPRDLPSRDFSTRQSSAPARSPVSVQTAPAVDSTSTPRRKRNRWLAMILGSWLALWLAAGAAIYFLFPVSSVVEAPIIFQNYDLLNLAERKQLRDEQQALLTKEGTRGAARRLLSLDPEISPGFLEDPELYLATVTNTEWPESRKGTMILRHRGKEDAGDKPRMAAIAQALYELNKPRIDDAKRATDRKNELNDSIARNVQQQQQLAGDIEKLRAAGDSAPDAAAINKIKADISTLDKQWSDALAAVKSCEAELAQLKQSAGAGATTQPTTNPSETASVAIGDDQVGQMETQLKDLSTKMAAAQATKTEQAAQARKALDATLSDFEKQVASTRELMKDSPELAAYVAAAQQLQTQTRQLIDDLIRVQEQQYGRLNELKTTLTQKMEQKRVEQQQSDPQLKELNERLETATRQLNAAKSAGMKKEIDDKQSEVDLLGSMARSRQEQLPKDAIKDYADTIDQLQSIIDVTQKNVEDDRKRTDQLLAQLQKSFTSSQTVEKLPEAQKSAASELEKKLADINAAREQYNTAISATAVNEEESVKQMRTQIAALQSNIDARRKEIADASQRNLSQQQEKSRQEQIAQKESQLADLNKTEADARQTYTNREKDLREAQSSALTARESVERLQGLQEQKQKLDAQIEQDRRGVDKANADADRAVQPRQPNENDIVVRTDPDKRWMYFGGTTVAIFVTFAGLLLFTLNSANLANAETTTFQPPHHESSNGNSVNGNFANGESEMTEIEATDTDVHPEIHAE